MDEGRIHFSHSFKNTQPWFLYPCSGHRSRNAFKNTSSKTYAPSCGVYFRQIGRWGRTVYVRRLNYDSFVAVSLPLFFSAVIPKVLIWIKEYSRFQRLPRTIIPMMRARHSTDKMKIAGNHTAKGRDRPGRNQKFTWHPALCSVTLTMLPPSRKSH